MQDSIHEVNTLSRTRGPFGIVMLTKAACCKCIYSLINSKMLNNLGGEPEVAGI